MFIWKDNVLSFQIKFTLKLTHNPNIQRAQNLHVLSNIVKPIVTWRLTTNETHGTGTLGNRKSAGQDSGTAKNMTSTSHRYALRTNIRTKIMSLTPVWPTVHENSVHSASPLLAKKLYNVQWALQLVT